MVTVKELVRIKITEDGKTLSLLCSGDDLWRMKNKWMRKSQLVDWKGNWYQKTITDPQTGEIVRHCAEPLDLHRGYGSAKPKPKSCR